MGRIWGIEIFTNRNSRKMRNQIHISGGSSLWFKTDGRGKDIFECVVGWDGDYGVFHGRGNGLTK